MSKYKSVRRIFEEIKKDRIKIRFSFTDKQKMYKFRFNIRNLIYSFEGDFNKKIIYVTISKKFVDDVEKIAKTYGIKKEN